MNSDSSDEESWSSGTEQPEEELDWSETEEDIRERELEEESYDDIEKLGYGIYYNKKEYVAKVLPQISDLNTVTEITPMTNRMTPLCMACIFLRSEIVDMLLQAGADTNIFTCEPALSLAAGHKTGNLGLVKTLLAHGANVNARDHLGVTALHDACSDVNLEVVKCLLEAGANVNRTSASNSFPQGHLGCDHGFEAWGKFGEKETVLGMALLTLASLRKKKIKKGIAVVQLLSSAGARGTGKELSDFRESILSSGNITTGQREQLVQLVDFLKKPKRLVQLCCIQLRSLLSSPINKSAFQLTGILPDHICNGIVDFSLR